MGKLRPSRGGAAREFTAQLGAAVTSSCDSQWVIGLILQIRIPALQIMYGSQPLGTPTPVPVAPLPTTYQGGSAKAPGSSSKIAHACQFLGTSALKLFPLTGSHPNLHRCFALPGGEGGCSPAGGVTWHPCEGEAASTEAERSWL